MQKQYQAGNWKLPSWWTSDPPTRAGHKCSYQELVTFYDGWFVRTVLKHAGGINTLPVLEKE